MSPTNAAFAKLPKSLHSALLEPKNIGKLIEVRTYHVYDQEAKSTAVRARIWAKCA